MTETNLVEEKRSEIKTALNNFWEVINLTNKALREVKEDNKTQKAQIINLSEQLNSKESTLTHNNNDFVKLTEINNQVNEDKKILGDKIELLNKELEEKSNFQFKFENLLITNNGLEENIKILQNQINELSIFKTKATETDERNEELIKQNELLSKKKMELEDYQSHFGFAQKEITRRNFDLHQKEEIIQKQKETIADLESKVYKARENEKKIQEYIAQNKNYENELNSLKDEKQDFDKKVITIATTSDNEINELKDKLVAKENEIAEQISSLENLKQKSDNFYNELISVKSLYQTKEDDYNSQIEKLNQLQEELNFSKLAVQSLNKHNIEFIHNTTDTNLKISELQSNLEGHLQKVTELEMELELLNFQQNEFQSQNQELNTQVLDGFTRIKELEIILDQALVLNDLFEEEKNKTKKINKELEAQFNQKDEEIKLFTETIDAIKFETDIITRELRDKNAQEITKNEDLQFILSNNYESLNKYLKLNEELENDIQKLNIELLNHKTKLIDENLTQNDFDQLNLKLIELEYKISKKEDIIKDFMLRLTEANEEITLLNFDIEISKSNLENNIDNLNKVIESDNKNETTIASYESKIIEINEQLNEKTMILEAALIRISEFEDLIMLRYEQIGILEEEINNLRLLNINSNEVIENHKANIDNQENIEVDNNNSKNQEVVDKLDNYILALENLLTKKS